MAMRFHHWIARRGMPWIAWLPPAAALLLAACQQETKLEAPDARPVRTMMVEKSELGEAISLTGHIQAENEATLAFRIPGRMIKRFVGAGDKIKPDQLLAKLDPEDERNALRSAQANLAAAQPHWPRAGIKGPF